MNFVELDSYERRLVKLLTALDENGSLICLADFKYQQGLRTLKEKGYFFCPTCKEKVILKIGMKKISHFAHYRDSACCLRYEKESDYHLAGKQRLYHWLKANGLEPELEVYDEIIQQRPDIRFIYQQKRYALEYQCSVIPEELFIKRTKAYQQNHYSPLWILGGNFFSRKSSAIVSLSDFQYLASVATDGQSLMRYYCPNANQFIFLKQIIPTTVRNALSSIWMPSLDDIDPDQFLMPQIHSSPSSYTWQKEIKNFKLYYSQNPQAFRDPFLKELYANHLHISLLPPEIGLPVSNSIFIRTPPVIWQGFVYLDGLKGHSKGDTISYYAINQAFKKRIWQKQICLRTLPMGKGTASNAVLEYLHLLVNCNYLTRVNDTTFKINNQLKIPTNVMEQEELELSFYKKYKYFFEFNSQ